MAASTESGPALLGVPVRRALREAALWVFGGLALMLLAALLSYSPTDGGFVSTGGDGDIRNLIGPVGAWLADFLLALFGRPAYLFPLMLAYAGWLMFRPRAEGDPLTGNMLAFRAAGFIVTLATSCGLATLHFSSIGLPESELIS